LSTDLLTWKECWRPIRPIRADLAVRYDNYAVRSNKIAVKGDDDHSAAIVVREIYQDPPHRGAGGRIEFACRLIGQDQQRIVGGRAGDWNPLALPA
jgi:hypothetical protein